MKVLFVQQPRPESVPAGTEFKKGWVYDLPKDSVERWKRRGVVTDDQDQIAAAMAAGYADKSALAAKPAPEPAASAEPVPEPVVAPVDPGAAEETAPVEETKEHDPDKGPEHDPAPETVAIPENWANLPWPKLKKLASQLTPTPVRNGEDAKAAIEAELARRA